MKQFIWKERKKKKKRHVTITCKKGKVGCGRNISGSEGKVLMQRRQLMRSGVRYYIKKKINK